MIKKKYKILEKNEDPKAIVIEKTGITATFTMYELDVEDMQLEKMLKEFKGQKKLADAKISNIETHHPWVKDLTPEQLLTAHMYQENIAMARVLEPKIKQVEEAQSESILEREEIENQLEIKFNPAEKTPDEKETHITNNK